MAFDVKNFGLLERDLCVFNIGYCHYSSYTFLLRYIFSVMVNGLQNYDCQFAT